MGLPISLCRSGADLRPDLSLVLDSRPSCLFVSPGGGSGAGGWPAPEKFATFLCWLLALWVGPSAAQTSGLKAQQIQAHTQKAQAALQANDPHTAVDEFRAVLALDPKNAAAHTNLGVISFLQGDCGNAAGEFHKALTIQPLLPNAQALLGICEKRRGDPAAKALLEKSLPGLQDSKLRLQAGMALTGIYYQEGDLGRAAALLQRLVDLDPENVDLLYMTQRVHGELADETLNKLAVLAPASARMQQVIAERLINAGDLDGAIPHYKKALELDPNLSGVRYELAEATLERKPADSEAQKEAEQELGLAVKSEGDNANIECLLGKISLLHSDLVQAYAHYSRALSLNVNDAESQLGLGRTLMRMDKPEEAKKYLLMAVQSNPLNAEAHYRLALAYRKLSLPQDAERELKLFQEIKKTKDQITELYRQMNKHATPVNTGDDTSTTVDQR